MSASLPLIQGKLNGMEVIARGDSVAFYAGKAPTLMTDPNCLEDLHCTMHKNHTQAVLLNPRGVLIVQQRAEKSQYFENSTSNLLPLLSLNTLKDPGTASSESLFIPTGQIEPTPTMPTLYTGIPVIDQTPGVSWINSETMKLLAETVQMMNLLETSNSSDDELTPILPSPTDSVNVLTTITTEEDELLRRLTSTPAIPVRAEDSRYFMEEEEFLLETDLDILKIRPSPSQLNSSGTETASFTFTVKQMGTATGGGTESTSSKNDESTQSHQSSDTPQASSLPNALLMPGAVTENRDRPIRTTSRAKRRPREIKTEASLLVTGLPGDVWPNIFKYLDPHDELKTLRAVNKALKNTVDTHFAQRAARHYLETVSLKARDSWRKRLLDVFTPDCSQQQLSVWLEEHWPGRYEVQILGNLDRDADYFPAYLAYTVKKALDDTPRFTLVERCEIKESDIIETGDVRGVAISPDSSTLVITPHSYIDPELTPSLYKLDISGNWLKHSELNHRNPLTAAFSPDGVHLVTVAFDFTVKVWRKEDNDWNHEVFSDRHSRKITDVSFNHDGTYLATSSEDGTARISKLDEHNDWLCAQTLKPEVAFSSNDYGPYKMVCVHFSPDGRHLITVSSGYDFQHNDPSYYVDIAYFWWLNKQHKWEILREVRRDKARINVVAFSPDKKSVLLASSGSDSNEEIWVFDEVTGWFLKGDIKEKFQSTSRLDVPRLRRRGRMVIAGHFNPNNGQLIVSTYDHTSIIFRLDEAEIEEEQRLEHSNWARNARFSPEGSHIVSWSWPNNNHTVQIWGQVGDGVRRRWVVKASVRCKRDVHSAILSPDQRFLLVSEQEGYGYLRILEIKPNRRNRRNRDASKPDKPSCSSAVKPPAYSEGSLKDKHNNKKRKAPY